jgi:hypothetical protein
MPGVHLFWSNASGGFDDIGGTVVGSTITGQVMHFSVGFAAVPAADGGDAGLSDGSASSDGGANADAAGGGHDAASPDTSVNGGDASAGADDASAGGHDAGTASDDASAGGVDANASPDRGAADAGAGTDAASLCATFGLNAPVFTPTLVTDGSSAPAGSTYTGGTIPSGQAYLSAVTHYGSQYGGPAQEVMIFDWTAHTLRIVDRLGQSEYYVGLENLTNADAHTIVGDVVCTTYPQAYPSQLSWSYSSGQKLVMSMVGSADVDSYIIP